MPENENSLLATSMINDGAYTRELVGHLIDVTEAITRSTIPAGEALGDEMSLHIEEIADIARRSAGAGLAEDLGD